MKTSSLLHWTYRTFLSPVLHFLAGYGWGCRFHPTCSVYFADAIQKHGWIRGLYLGVCRLGRCHPFSSAPYFDPVPQHCFCPDAVLRDTHPRN